MRIVIMVIICCIIVVSAGCAYSNFRLPLDTDFNETTLGTKVGKSHYQSVLWMVTWGDAGTYAASKAGGLKKINHADQEFLSILFGLYTKHTTIVYGD